MSRDGESGGSPSHLFRETSRHSRVQKMNAPIHTIRFGLIKASIWHRDTRGGERHSVSLVRLYRDGDTWKESTRFGRDDLLAAAKVLDLAHSWIHEQIQNGRSEIPNVEE